MTSIDSMKSPAPPSRESRILAAAVQGAGMKKAAIAAAAKCSPAELYQWETGRRPVPPERAPDLAAALGISDPASISPGYAEVAARTEGAIALAIAPKSPGEQEAPTDLAIARLQNDVHALTLALGAMTAVMTAHRPAEAQALAGALRRNVPAKFRDRGLIHELLEVLDKVR